MERELRAAAGRASARARGKTGGRPRTDVVKLANAKILYENSDKTAGEAVILGPRGAREVVFKDFIDAGIRIRILAQIDAEPQMIVGPANARDAPEKARDLGSFADGAQGAGDPVLRMAGPPTARLDPVQIAKEQRDTRPTGGHIGGEALASARG